MIKGMVVPAVKEGKEIEDVVDKKAEEKLEKMAEEFKPQANWNWDLLANGNTVM